jgi:hypothetical protein
LNTKQHTLSPNEKTRSPQGHGLVLICISACEEREELGQGWRMLVVCKYAPGDTVLEGLEKAAREAKKGLWVTSVHVPPWERRKMKVP